MRDKEKGVLVAQCKNYSYSLMKSMKHAYVATCMYTLDGLKVAKPEPIQYAFNFYLLFFPEFPIFFTHYIFLFYSNIWLMISAVHVNSLCSQ